MKYVWKFDVVNRPSKDTDGITNAFQDFTLKGTVAGDVIPVGSIVKSRGNASYDALNLDGDRVGVFDTRSKAAHALRKHRVATVVAATAAATDAINAPYVPDESGSEVVETVEAVETTTRTVALDDAPAILGITLGDMMSKIQAGEIKTTENADGVKQVVIEDDLGGEAA